MRTALPTLRAATRRRVPTGLAVVAALVAGGCSPAGLEVTVEPPPTPPPAPAAEPETAPDTSGAGSEDTLDGPEAADPPSPELPAVPGGDADEAEATPVPRPIVWAACGGGLDCATLDVPVDHADPDGDSIELALIRRPADDPGELIGPLLVNPGGPGGPGVSGVDFVREDLESFMDDEIAARFDIIGFDPRGVGASAPIDCREPVANEAYDPRAASRLLEDQVAQALDDAQDLAEACISAHGGYLDRIGTVSAARDLELIRQALGAGNLNYLGFSYGTRLGAAYAELFPDRIRALVLDAADTLDKRDPREALEQGLGFERAFAAFADWCADRPGCPLEDLGGAVAVMGQLDETLRRDVLEVDDSITGGTNRRLDHEELYLGVLTALYAEQVWPDLAFALAIAAEEGDGTILQFFADFLEGRNEDGTYSNETEALVAINCADDPDRIEPAGVVSAAEVAARELDVFAPLAAFLATECVFWPPAAEPLPDDIDGAGAPPILVIGTTGDPATPYAWAVDMADRLESAVLLTYEGTTHTAFGTSQCATAAAVRYLVDLIVPDELRCTS